MNLLTRIKLILLLLLLITLSVSARPVDDLSRSTQSCKGWVKWDLNDGYNPNNYNVYAGTNDQYLYSNNRKDIQLNVTRSAHSITVNYVSDAGSRTRHPMYLCQKSFPDGTSSGNAHNQSDHVPCDDWCTTIYTGGGCPPLPQPQVPAKFSISDQSVLEGNNGITYLSFRITLNRALTNYSYVFYKTSNGTALNGEDYNYASNYAYFPAGQTSKIINIEVKGDKKIENDETFYVDLYAPYKAEIADGHGVGTILNDDRPSISINNKSLTEGNAGTKDFTFTVTLNSASNQYVSVRYKTNSNIAKANEDYTAISSKTLYFTPGQVSKTITVKVKGDTKVEENEIFYVDLSYATKASISKSRGIGTIINDDTPSISITDKELIEGDIDTKDFIFTVRLNKASIKPVTVKYKTMNNTALAGEDYNEISLNTLTFNVGETSKTITVKVKGDTKVENNEIFYVDLSSPTNASITDSRGLGTILNDDKPTIAITNKKLIEGDTGTKDFVFTITLNKSSTKTVTVNYKTTNGTALAGEDYTSLAINTLTFYPGEISKNITVKINGDTKIENDETFHVDLSSATNALISDNQGVGTIQNDDKAPPPVVIEPITCLNSAFMIYDNPAVISTLKLSTGSMIKQKSQLSSSKINAAGYNKKDGFIWAYDQKKQDGTLLRIGKKDNKYVSEAFKVANLNISSFVGDINDDGHLYLKESTTSTIHIIDLDPSSPNYLKKIDTLNVNKSLKIYDWAFNPLDGQLYTVTGGKKNYLYKINPVTGTSFRLGDTKINKKGAFGATFFDREGRLYAYNNNGGIYVIQPNISTVATLFSNTRAVSDNDGAMCSDATVIQPPKIDIADEEIVEGNSGTKNLIFTVSLDNYAKTFGSVQFDYQILNGTNSNSELNAKTPLDYINNHIKKRITLKGNTTSYQISVPIKGDTIIEKDEEFKIVISNIKGATASKTTAIGKIINDDNTASKFTCNSTLYLSNRNKIGKSSINSGMTWLHSIDRTKTPYSFKSIGEGYQSINGGYNAIGYNIKDDFIYGLFGNLLVKLDNQAQIQELGPILGLTPGQRYAGEFDRDGFYYVTGSGGFDDKLYKIDINQRKVVKTITLSQSVKFWDMAIDKTGKYFYVMLINNNFKNDKVAKIEIATGNITPIGKEHNKLPSYISLVFADKDGNTFMMSNKNGYYYANMTTGELTLLSSTEDLNFYNDGTSCPNTTMEIPAQLYISNEQVVEGNSGTTNMQFTVSLDKPANKGVSFEYQVFDGNNVDITKNATSPSDYTKDNSSKKITLNGSTQVYTFNISVKGDTDIEEDEEFRVVISNVNGAIVAKGTATGTIINDDSANPCDPITSGNKDTDGDGVTDICDLDIDNDGILNTKEGTCVIAQEVQNNKVVYILDTSGSVVEQEYRAWTKSINELSTELLKTNPNTEIAIIQYGSKKQNTNTANAHISRYFANTHPNWSVYNRNTDLGSSDHLPSSLVDMRNFWVAGGDLDLTQNSHNTIIIFTDAWKYHKGSVLANNSGNNYDTTALPDYGEYNFLKETYNAKIIMLHADINTIGGYEAARAISSKDKDGKSLAQLGTFTLSKSQINAISNASVSIENSDSDNDGIANCYDLDSDNDGIPDNIEAQSTQGYIKPNNIFDDNGVDSAYLTEIIPVDTDSDGDADYLDLDSDNDTILDIDESGLGNNDTNNDGRTDANVGVNGLDNSATHENADDYQDINGQAYNNNIFFIKDSDADVKVDGSNAAPTAQDFDYRDDVDNTPILTVSGLKKLEGDSGATEFIVPITLSRPAPKGGIKLNYKPLGDKVYSDDFAYGVFDEFFDDNPNAIDDDEDDNDDEDEENYKVEVSIYDASIAEGDEGETELLFKLTLNTEAPVGGISVVVEPKDITAKEGEDYRRDSSSIYFQAGSTVAYAPFIILGDIKEEKDETFDVEIQKSSNITIVAKHKKARGTIRDDDTGFFRWGRFMGKQGSNKIEKANSSNNIKVIKKANKQNIVLPSIFINEGETTGFIVIPVKGDENVENNEPFNLELEILGTAKFDNSQKIQKSKKKLSQKSSTAKKTIEIIIINDDKDLKDKIIAEYYLDECEWDGLINDVNDSSGNNNHATTTADLNTVSDGKVIRAGEFPNKSGKIGQYSIVSSLNMQDIGGKGAVSFWFKSKDNWNGGKARTLIDATKGDKYFFLSLSSDGKLHYNMEDKNDGDFISSTHNSFNFLKDEWVHITITWDLTNNYKIYVNAQEEVLDIKTNTIAQTSFSGLGKLTFGNYNKKYSSAGRRNSANGFMDEIKILHNIPTDKQITNIYNNELTGKDKDGHERIAPECSALKRIIANYHFDECYWTGASNEVVDSSENSLHGQAYGNANTVADAKVGRSAIFDGKGDYVEVMHNDKLNPTKDFSISTWFKAKKYDQWNGVVTKLENGNGNRDKQDGWNIQAGSQQKIASLQGNTATGWKYVRNTTAPVINKWYHAVMVNKNNTTHLYIDGVEEKVTPNIIEYNDAPLQIAKFYTNSNNLTFNGQIDEVKLFNGALTESEVKIIYDNENIGQEINGTKRVAPVCPVPGLTIDDITKKEGDSGLTSFDFTVSLDSPSPTEIAFTYTLNDGDTSHPAQIANNDYVADSQHIRIPAGSLTTTISAQVVGDIEMEYNEDFSVILSNPERVTLTDNQGVGTIINDDMINLNIERVNSDTANNLDEKYNLYTQIAKKDFNYAIIAYDENSSNVIERKTSDLTVKVELIDGTDSNESTNRLTTQPMVATFDNQSRIKIINNTDLENIYSTNVAHFKIYYPIDMNNSIIRNSSCTDVACLEKLPNFKEFKSIYSKDSFSIRPAGFKLNLFADDNGNAIKIGENHNAKTESLTAGYNYDLDISAIGYTDTIEEKYELKNYIYDSSHKKVFLNNQELNTTLVFDDNETNCADTDDKPYKYFEFINGKNIKTDFMHDNVGKYLINVTDINWTNIDYSLNSSRLGCVLNSSSNIPNSQGMYGCNIQTKFNSKNENYFDMKVNFEPYKFDVAFTLTTQPNALAKFLYMSNLNITERMAMLMSGNIIAKSKNGKTTTNFTNGCHASDVDFQLDYSATTQNGDFNNSNPIVINTTENTLVTVQRKIKHNNSAYLAIENNALDSNITLNKDKFEDNATIKGSSSLAILYNINKHLTQTINPVRIDFNRPNVSSKDASSKVAITNKYIPIGEQDLNSTKFFYYSRVAPDLENYPATYKRSISTPIAVEIFCNETRAWCRDMNVSQNGFNSNHTSIGWYTVREHNVSIDGNINLNVQADSDGNVIPANSNIQLIDGKEGRAITSYTGNFDNNQRANDTVVVDIASDSWLNYNKDNVNPSYTANYKRAGTGVLSGVGKVGNVVNIKANIIPSKKLDW